MKLAHYVLVLAIVLASSSPEAAAGRRCSISPSLRGGPGVQKLHNLQADTDGLSRLGIRNELLTFIGRGLLVPIRDTGSYYLDKIGGHDPGHSELYRYIRPWTKRFLDRELGPASKELGHRFKLISFVRTEVYQERICRSGNRAATCSGAWSKRSLHLTGATVDISKEGMSRKTLAWMRKRLIRLRSQGLVGPIEECGAFHVFVRKAYGSVSDKPHKAKKIQKATKKKKHRRARH